MTGLSVCLWFDAAAEEAATFYVALFREAGRDAAMGDVSRYGPSAQRPEGGVMSAGFRLEGQSFMALNGGPVYALTPAASLYVACETQAEIDLFWERLGEGGQPLRCGWLTDRFGLSWQIIPRALGAIMGGSDSARAGRAMKALMGMTKVDVAALEAA